LSRYRLEGDLTAMAFDDDTSGDVQAEPGALAHIFGGEERLEDSGIR
jgi:hypothetical protein